MRIFFVLFFLLGQLYARIPANDAALERIAKEPQRVPFSFAVMGDNRDGEGVFEKILEKLDKSESIFSVNNGDLVANGWAYQFKEYVGIISKYKKPILSAIGNHEIPLFFSTRSNFKKYIGKPYFSFVYANSYFIFLDNANKKKIKKKQLRWLKAELKKAQSYANRFVFLHVPLYDPRKGPYKKGHSMKNLKNAKELNELFDRYGVTMLFASHIHSYYSGVWHKTPYIITGGAGAPNERDGGFYHYIIVHVKPEGVSYELKRL